MAKRHWLMALLAGIGVSIGLGAIPKAAHAADDGGTLTISNAQFLWTCGFSPFNPSQNFLSVGTVYEPLMFVNALQNGKTSPWLATAYAWSDDDKTLTFTLRRGVKWTDYPLHRRRCCLHLQSYEKISSARPQRRVDAIVERNTVR